VNGSVEMADLELLGEPIPFRESTFLQNPRLPEHVRSSRIAVDVCKA
jgi:hypothetical protein